MKENISIILTIFVLMMAGFGIGWSIPIRRIIDVPVTTQISVLKEKADCEAKDGIFNIEDNTGIQLNYLFSLGIKPLPEYEIQCLAPAKPDIFDYPIN